jgi:hypothetical protein
MTLAAWPLSYVYCWHVRFTRLAVDVRGGAYYVTDNRGMTGLSTSVDRFDGTYAEDALGTRPQRWRPTRVIKTPSRPDVCVIPAWYPLLLLSSPSWLDALSRWKARRAATHAQPARPGRAGG